MLNYKPHYGFLSILGFDPEKHREKKRRKGIFKLKIGTHPPGCGKLDNFQFGRDSSKTNDYLIFDISFYKKKYKKELFISRYSFTIIGHADTSIAYLFSGGKNSRRQFKDSKNPILLKYSDEIGYKRVPPLPSNLHNVNFLELSCALKDKSLINIGGTSLFWRNYAVHIPDEWLKIVNEKNEHLDETQRLSLSLNKVLHLDFTGPLCKFLGCQHVISKRTAEFWTSQVIIHGRSNYIACCPFCDEELQGDPGFVEIS